MKELIRELMTPLVIIVVIVGVSFTFVYTMSKYEVRVINDEYGTDYTTMEMMFADRQIRRILDQRQPQRPEKRVYEFNRPLVEVENGRD